MFTALNSLLVYCHTCKKRALVQGKSSNQGLNPDTNCKTPSQTRSKKFTAKPGIRMSTVIKIDHSLKKVKYSVLFKVGNWRFNVRNIAMES